MLAGKCKSLALPLLLAVALALRLAAAFWWQDRLPSGVPFAFPDSESYWALGRAIARGEPYEFGDQHARIFRAPGYPLCLAPLFSTWHEPPVLAARALSAVLGTAAIAAVAWIAAQNFDRPTALVAATLVAFYPGAIAMSLFVLSEAPFIPLMLAQLGCLTAVVRSEREPVRWRWALGAGILSGLATLCRPSWLLFTPMVAVPLVMVSQLNRGRRKAVSARREPRPVDTLGRALGLGGTMLVGLFLVLSPWWVRNYQTVGAFVPTTLQAGAGLYDGWNPHATGGSDMRFVQEFTQQMQLEDAASESPSTEPFELRLDRRLHREALAWATEHPGRVVELAAIKFARLWNIFPNADEFSSITLRLVTIAGYIPAVGLGLWGLWRTVRQNSALWICVLPAVYLTLLHTVFVSSLRYREPAMLALLVPAAAGLLELTSTLDRWLRPRAANIVQSPEFPTESPVH